MRAVCQEENIPPLEEVASFKIKPWTTTVALEPDEYSMTPGPMRHTVGFDRFVFRTAGGRE
jgi:hypothetical protein